MASPTTSTWELRLRDVTKAGGGGGAFAAAPFCCKIYARRTFFTGEEKKNKISLRFFASSLTTRAPLELENFQEASSLPLPLTGETAAD